MSQSREFFSIEELKEFMKTEQIKDLTSIVYSARDAQTLSKAMYERTKLASEKKKTEGKYAAAFWASLAASSTVIKAPIGIPGMIISGGLGVYMGRQIDKRIREFSANFPFGDVASALFEKGWAVTKNDNVSLSLSKK